MQFIYYIIVMKSDKDLNLKLRLARIEKGFSQQELADRVEATRQTLGLIEAGKYNPTLNLCIKIAKALDKTLDQLFWPEEEKWLKTNHS